MAAPDEHPKVKTEQGEVCYRHTDRPTGIHCTRCGNPICVDCMVAAPVGHHCPTCVGDARRDMKKVRRVAWSRPEYAWHASYLVWILAGVNVAAFLLSEFDTSIVPRFANSRFGIADGEYYRLLTSTFLHGGIVHLLLNTFALVVLGPEVEAVLGKWRFLALYVAAGLGASTASYLVGPSGSVGASGAIFGLLGALFVISRMRRLRTTYTLGYVAISLLIASVLLPNVDNVGHIGGVVTGTVVAAAFEFVQLRRRAVLMEAAAWCAIVGTILGLAVGINRARQVPSADGYPLEAVLEHQIDLLRQQGVSYEAILTMTGPWMAAYYQAVETQPVRFTAYVLRDPQRPRTVKIDFGDGTSATAPVPAGSGVIKRDFTHRFPEHTARYEQVISIESVPSTQQTTITDVCPDGLDRRPIEDALEAMPMCSDPGG